MLEAVIIVLLFLWLIGLIANITVGGLIHLLLLVALVGFVARMFSDRRTA